MRPKRSPSFTSRGLWALVSQRIENLTLAGVILERSNCVADTAPAAVEDDHIGIGDVAPPIIGLTAVSTCNDTPGDTEGTCHDDEVRRARSPPRQSCS